MTTREPTALGNPAALRAARAPALLAAAHPGPALVVTLVAGGLAQAAGLEPVRVALVVAAVLAGQLSIGWSNDLVDRDRDAAAGRRDKPVATGAVGVPAVRRACGAAVAVAVVLSLLCGLAAGAVHLALVAAGWAYNLGLKATALSWLPYAWAFGSLPVFVFAAYDPPAWPPWWAPLVGALLGVGAHLLNALPDLAADRATGVHGLPHRLGARRSMAAAIALLVAASVVVTLDASEHRGPVVWAALGVVLALAAVALAGTGRTPFRAALSIALVDVAVLVWVL